MPFDHLWDIWYFRYAIVGAAMLAITYPQWLPGLRTFWLRLIRHKPEAPMIDLVEATMLVDNWINPDFDRSPRMVVLRCNQILEEFGKLENAKVGRGHYVRYNAALLYQWLWRKVAKMMYEDRNASQAQEIDSIGVATQAEIEQFKVLVPKLQRLASFCRPRDVMSSQIVAAADPFTRPNIRAEYQEVRAALDSLGIECPTKELARGSEDWFYFATLMVGLANQGKLAEARKREPE